MFIVVRPTLARKHILQMLLRVLLDDLLQGSLVVLKRLWLVRLQHGQDKAEDKLARFLHTGVQVNGGDHRLKRIRQNGRAGAPAGILLAVAQPQIIPQVDLLRKAAACLFAHQGSAVFGEIPLGKLRVIFKQIIRNHKPEHRIAQKLQALVALFLALCFVCIGGMGQCGDEVFFVVKTVP